MSASWVVIRKSTGEVLFETFNRKLAIAINRAVYDVVPIIDYLSNLNDRIKGETPCESKPF